MLFLALPQGVFAATLSVSPSFASVAAGDTVSATVVVSSSDQPMNAVSGSLFFSNDTLTLLSVSKAASIVTIWATEPSFSNANGSASFEGIVPNPGFRGGGGKVLTLTFRAKKAGTATLSFASASVLANDGQGTEILGGNSGATISIASAEQSEPEPPAATTVPVAVSDASISILSSTHPDQARWYANNAPELNWGLPQGALEARTLIGENATGDPSVRYAPAISSKKVSNLPDGIFYFSLKVRTEDGWSPVSRFRINIDTVAPKPFIVSMLPLDPQEGNRATFSTTDTLSGVDHYDILINGVAKASITPAEADGAVFIPPSTPGTSTLAVIAYDRAGNTASSNTLTYQAIGGALSAVSAEPGQYPYTFALSIPFETLFSGGWVLINYLSVLLVIAGAIGGVVFALWYLWHRVHKVRRRLLRHIATTDKNLHAELIEIHKALKDEVERLKTEGAARELTSEEKRIMKRFSKLVEKTQHTMAEEFSREV